MRAVHSEGVPLWARSSSRGSVVQCQPACVWCRLLVRVPRARARVATVRSVCHSKHVRRAGRARVRQPGWLFEPGRGEAGTPRALRRTPAFERECARASCARAAQWCCRACATRKVRDLVLVRLHWRETAVKGRYGVDVQIARSS